MIKVRPRPNEPVQQLMRRLKKLCEREGVLREMKRTAYYEKPSDRKRRSMRKSKRALSSSTNNAPVLERLILNSESANPQSLNSASSSAK